MDNLMKETEYDELLKERRKELKEKKTIDDEIPKGAIPVPPPNWNKKHEVIPILYPPYLDYKPQYNLGNIHKFTNKHNAHSPIYDTTYQYLDNIDYNNESDSDDYKFDGNEIFESLDSIDDKSPIIPPTTPRRINKSKLIPIKSKSESDITSLDDDIIIGNPYDKHNIDKLNSIKTKTRKNSPKNKNKTVKKNSRKMPGPLKLPGSNGGRKNKTSRKHKKTSRKHKKKSRKHKKTSRK